VEVIKGAGGTWIKTDEAGRTSDPKIMAVGDVERPGLATNALGAGKKAAQFIVSALKGEEWKPAKMKVIVPDALTLTHYCPEPTPGTSPESEADRCASCGTCRDCHLCETICPTNAISRRDLGEIGYEYVSDDNKCIACGFCRDTCPCGIWTMQQY
jgi:ferredoxin